MQGPLAPKLLLMFSKNQKQDTKMVALGKRKETILVGKKSGIISIYSQIDLGHIHFSTKILRVGGLNDTGFLNQTKRNTCNRETSRIVQFFFFFWSACFNIILSGHLLFLQLLKRPTIIPITDEVFQRYLFSNFMI